MSPSGEHLFCIISLSNAWLCHWCLGFSEILEFSPHANVARNISPVPVLNCELLMAQSHTEKDSVLSRDFILGCCPCKMRAKHSIALEALLKTLQISVVYFGESGDAWLGGTDSGKQGCVFHRQSGKCPQMKPPALWSVCLQRLHPPLCGSERGDGRPWCQFKDSAALFMLSYISQNNWQKLFFVQMSQNDGWKQHKSSRAGVVSRSFIYLKVLFLFCLRDF